MRRDPNAIENSPSVPTKHAQSTLPTPAGRVRPRSVSEDRPKAIQLKFTIEHRGKYFRSSKRRIRWSFAINTQEHEVVLVWSLKSGKTRIFWNGQDISNLFHTNGRSGMVEVSWETRSHEKLQVVAHSESSPGTYQYDLLIDGVSFHSLPTREMAVSSEKRAVVSPSVVPSSLTAGSEFELAESRAEDEDLSDDDEGSEPDPEMPYEDLGWRLMRAGLSGGVVEREPVDELHSDLYSPMVESLRTRITDHLPQTEGLVSRAIIHAFFPEAESDTSPSDGSVTDSQPEAQQVEADALFDADDWARLNLDYAPVVDAKDQALSYYQKRVEALFCYVRNDELPPEAATKILLNIAALLRLEFAKPLPGNTLILKGLDKIAPEDFASILSGYGPIDAVGLCKSRCFGFCRFQDHGAARRLLLASEHERLFMGGEKVTVMELSKQVEAFRMGKFMDVLPERAEVSEGSTEEELRPRASSGTENVPHLMGAMSSDDVFSSPDIDTYRVGARCASDGWVDTGLYDELKMPARQVSPDSVMQIRKGSGFFPDGGYMDG